MEALSPITGPPRLHEAAPPWGVGENPDCNGSRYIQVDIQVKILI
jgi:hypothetical protein